MTTLKTKVAERLTRSITTKAATAVTCLAAALPFLLGANNTQAAGYAGTQFEIEMVVFSRTQGMNASRETWPTNPVLTYDSKWVDFNTPSRGDPLVPALQPATNQLNNKVAALTRDPGYEVLFHKTWRQVLQTERNAPAVLINGGDVSGDHHQLEGSVTLSVARYLHLSTDLWLSEWADQSGFDQRQWSPQAAGNDAPLTAPTGIAVPARPRALQPKPAAEFNDEPMGLTSTENPGSLQSSGYSEPGRGGFSTTADRAVFHGEQAGVDTAPAPPAEKIAKRVAVLQEERRLRSGELHYIDHPKLGVLIEVRTVKPSPEDALEPTGLTD
ncbi:hypothetical protein HXX02_14550 [Microbulbifer elongatus]|uniref:Peptidoglycan-binding protein CsiV n=1 Tax=Microbulbifer elongatus TaxID=86173 RepID=A0ABT1P557_9GAMM|nr:CsiV family protein [Microbulbifer elongatus]MCQ3830657.1 hypothetical protein [Microbulbifer elongatus]